MSAASSALPLLPTHLLYASNLNEKASKATLKQALMGLVAPYGALAAVHVTKTAALRGQAWLDFGAGNTDKAAAALRDLQGAVFLDKPIVSHPRATRAHIERSGFFSHGALPPSLPRAPAHAYP